MTGTAVGPRGGGLGEVNMIAQNTEHKSHLTAVKAGVSTNRWVQRKSLALVKPQLESQNSITHPVLQPLPTYCVPRSVLVERSGASRKEAGPVP